MSDHSDSDSSPKGSDSSSRVGDDEKKHSSDESASSDGVLVELPANPDQDDSREDMFEDATDEPATPGDGMETPRGLEESMAMIEIGESSASRDAEELARMRARLEDSMAECKKHREEREVFGREVASLRRLLLDMAKCDSLATSSEEADIPSPTPLHAMLADCSKFALHLKTTDDRSDLKGLLLTKEQEIEDLRAKNMESVVSHDVIFSYLDSLHGSWSESLKERLLPSLDTVIGEEGPTDTDVNVLSLVEKKTLSLVEIHRQFLSEIDQLRQCLVGFRPEFENFADVDSTTVLTTVRERLIEAKKREDDDLDGLNKVKNENEGLRNQMEKLKSSLDAASAETSKVKGELEQAESKYIAVKEKLSMAVTKGKSLVQTRDSLKQSLAEKNGELEKCMGELKVKSDALHSSEVRVEEFRRLLEEKTNEYETCMQQLQASETRVEELHGLIAEKSGGIEACLQELKEKNDELRASNLMVEDLRRSLEEKTTAFESSMQELQATEITLQELRRSLEEKNTELKICVQELKEKSEELQESEVKVAELQKLLEEKTTGFETHLEQNSAALRDVQELLEVKSSNLEQCMLELQQKSDLLQASEAAVKELEKAVEEKVGELERFSVESQQKIGHVQATEVTIKELEELLEEKKSELERHERDLQASEHMVQDLQKVLEEKKYELDRCALDLQQKSDVLQATELTVKQLEQSLEEQAGKLDKCMLDLHTSEATVRELEKLLEEKDLRFQETEMTISELKKLVEEQSGELEKRFKESTERSLELETVKAGMGELSNAQSTLDSIQLSLSQKENKLQEMEIILGEFSYPDELSLADPVEKLRWIGDQKKSFESKVKDALASVAFPETVSSVEIDSQIIWLLESLNQAREDASKSKEESSLVNLQLSALNEEINRLTESLSEEKQERDVLTNEVDELSAKLSVISSEKHELVKALEESFQIKYDSQNPSTELVIEKCISSIRETAKSALLNSANLEKLQSLLYERDQELDMCKKLLEEDGVGKTETKSLTEEVEKLKNEKDSLQKELERVEEKDAVGKTEIKTLTEEVERLKNEKDSLQKELERVEEKNALVREKLSMAVKKGKGLVAEREGFKQALDEKSAEIEALKTDLKSKDSIVKNLREQINELSPQLTSVNELELKAVSLQEKLDEAKNSLEESENVKARLLKELSEAMSTSQILENELGKEKERISNIIKEKEEILCEKDATEQELERVNKEASTSASKLTDAFVTIKSLEDVLSKANKDALLLESAQVEVVTRHEKEISELSAKLADCTEELRETRERLEKSVSERTSELEKIKEVMQDETLLYMVKEEFRRKINSLRGMGLLMHDMHQQFSAKGYSIDPSIEVSGFVKFLSLPSYDKFINERNTHNNSEKRNWREVNSISSMAEGLVDQSKHMSKYFEDLSSYMDDHITLMSQALQATSEEFFHMMDSEDNVKLELEKLEVQYKAQEEKLKKAELGSERALKDLQLYEERIATLEKDYFNLEGACNEMKSKIEDYQARENLLKTREDELALLPQGLIKDRGLSGLYFSEDEMASLIDKVNTLEFSFNEPESTPVEKLLNILDQFNELHQRVDFLTYENGDLQSALASSSTETDNLKSECETIHASLEKIVQKLVQLGGKDIPPDQKQATTMALLSFLEKVVVSLVHDYESSKLKLMEMEGKLQTREKMVGELSSRVKMLEDSYQSWASQAEIGRERSLVDASSSSKNSDEIEDLGAIGKSSITSTAARMTTRKVSSDHLILNIGTETDRLIASQESEGKGHVFKSLNTSGLIPVQGKFIADKVDSAWVSGSRVLMSQPRARLGVVAYCLLLHLLFLGSIVF
ncbi:Spindle pole body component 110 [Rhynchospora pubera]|uniref:Spindle pole body component 110 n=1 Tax=Rhynchospora pubera TaxID=906938 RepID=A0AAV8CQD0_9POAL|nr:Spindle pole body component 110 [Rhynchospora pubera]